MLKTPFGNIKILADGVAIPFEATPFSYIQSPIKDKPIDGCYRIHISVKNYHLIQCVLELNNKNVRVDGSSGERYLSKEFIDETTILTIGIEDENSNFSSERIENGMEYRIYHPMEEVVFGIAWTIDYEGISDIRTWLAADPTVYFKTERCEIKMKELESILTKQLSDMKVNKTVVCEKENYPIYLEGTENDYLRWKKLLGHVITSTKVFEIHCWNEEEDWIAFALKYGTLKESDWKYGKIIIGEVTPEFIQMLLEMPKAQNDNVFQKITPFFNVFLDDVFQSSHYGTEVYMR